MQENLAASIHRLKQKAAKNLPFVFPEKRGGIPHYLFASMLMALALWVRLTIAPLSAGLQYLTFFPSVAIAAVIGGFGPGMFAVAIGLSFATFVLTPPYWTISPEVLRISFWSNMVFIADGLIVCLSIEAMHRFRRQSEKESKEAKESEQRIRAINKELDEFTYIASHDLKEPLRGIHNYASFLEEDYAAKLEPQAQQYIHSIKRLAERMTMLTDRLLEYSRLGSAEIKREPVNLDAIVDEVIKDLGSLQADGVELRHKGRLNSATGDPVRIGEVFQNLISNAAKYNDKPEKWVEIGRDDSGAYPVYYVRDNGIGIKPEHAGSVFRIFKRLHEQSKFGGGTGAGLTIVKKIVERHGGKIWLTSVPGGGTTFYFTLTGDQ
jgi:signal transduction histidine kinase